MQTFNGYSPNMKDVLFTLLIQDLKKHLTNVALKLRYSSLFFLAEELLFILCQEKGCQKMSLKPRIGVALLHLLHFVWHL